MANIIVDPHVIGGHSLACRRGCIYGIHFCFRKPYLLDTKRRVQWANAIRAKMDRKWPQRIGYFKLGDFVWFKPKQ